MPATRLKFEFDDISFPDECPNCLATPATSPVRLSRHSGGLEVWTTSGWPHCTGCADDARWKQGRLGLLKWLIVSGVSLTVVSLLAYFEGGLVPDIFCFVAAAGGIGFVLLSVLFYRKSLHGRPRRANASTVGAGVELIRSGTSVLSGKQFLDIKLLNERYAEAFRRANKID